MLRLQPIVGQLVVEEHAARVVAPPYDGLTPRERAAAAAVNPDSYLGALPVGGDADDVTVLRRCREHLERLLAAGYYTPLPAPALLVLTLTHGAGRTFAIVGDVEVAAFRDGRILPHERTRPGRVAQLASYLEVVGVASSPVAICQRPHAAVATATQDVVATAPAFTFRAGDGTEISGWVVTDPAQQRVLAEAVARAGQGFVTDGHHRAHGAARYASTAVGDEAAGRVLTAIISSDQLTVLPFHRRIEDAGGIDAGEVAARLRAHGFAVRDLPGRARPSHAGAYTMTLDGRWWEVAANATNSGSRDPVDALDIRVLERAVLPALLGRAADLVPVADPLGLGALETPGGLGVALHPPGIEVILAIASARRTVPAKTTYVIPKMRSGLLVVPRGSHAPSGA